jgi:hypothetical protein
LDSLDGNVNISPDFDDIRGNIKFSPKTVYLIHGVKMRNQWFQKEHSKLLHETKQAQSEHD